MRSKEKKIFLEALKKKFSDDNKEQKKSLQGITIIATNDRGE